MATVPYDEGVSSVLPRTEVPDDYQRIQVPAAAFGSAVAEGAQRLGQGATQAAKLYQEVSAQQAANQFEDESNKLVYGDPSKTGPDGMPDRGLLGTRGEDALTKQAQVRQQILDLRDQYKGNLSSSDQELYFNNQTAFAMRRLLATIGAHYDSQFNVYAEGVNQAQANTALNLAASDPTNPAAVNSARENLRQAYVKQVHLKYGDAASPDLTNDAVNRADADLLERNVESLIGSGTPGSIQLANQIMQSPSASLIKGPRYDNLSWKLQHLDNKAQDSALIDRIFGGGAGSSGTPAIGVPGATGSGGGNWETQNNNFAGMRKIGVAAAGPEAGGFQSFATPEEGVTAIGHQLDRYASGATTGQPVTTLRGMVSTWAPPSENDTPLLIKRAAEWTGIDPDQSVDLADPTTRAKVITAFIRNEQGGKLPVDPSVIAKVAGLSPGATQAQAPPGFPTREDVLSRIPSSDQLPGGADQYNRLYSGVNQRYSRILQSISADRAQLESQYKGGLAMLQDGRDFQYDPDQFTKLFPAPQAQEMLSNLQGARTIGQQIVSVRGMSIGEIADKKVANQQILNNSTGDGYVRQSKLSKAFDTAADRHIQALAADPANYLLSTNPDIYDAARQAVASQSPSDAAQLRRTGQLTAPESYAAKTLAEQERLGVPADAGHVLSVPEAQQAAQSITKDPENAPQTLKALQQKWGSAWPQVWRDLSTTGKLPVNYQMVGVLDNEGDGALLARALGQANKEGGNKALDSLVDHGVSGNTQPSRVTKTFIEGDDGIKQYARSLVLSGASPDQVEGVVSSIDLLAKAKLLYGGETDPTTAATKAVQSAIGKYEFLPNGGARVPRDNASAIEENAGATVQNLDLGRLQIPDTYRRTLAPGSATADDWLRVLKANPNWVTVDNAIRLMDNGGRFVRTNDGGFVEVLFSAQPLAPQQAPAIPPVVITP